MRKDDAFDRWAYRFAESRVAASEAKDANQRHDLVVAIPVVSVEAEPAIAFMVASATPDGVRPTRGASPEGVAGPARPPGPEGSFGRKSRCPAESVRTRRCGQCLC